MLKTIELCEGCEKEYHAAYKTDDDVLLCADCYIDLLKEENTKLKDEYYELVFAVATKHPDETRHETAFRYIMEAESSQVGEDQAKGGGMR